MLTNLDRLTNRDRRDGLVYEFASDADTDVDALRLAAKVATITDRPLLLRGAPGVGKSSLASYLAFERGWRYYEHTVTARTEATDLLWTFDPVRRLGDVTRPDRGTTSVNDHDYVTPGAVWWAFDPVSAARRGGATTTTPAAEPMVAVNEDRSTDGAVVLIDEIDKADPDVPNALLTPLGSHYFEVTDTGTVVRQEREHVLVIITTNEERQLPPAFVRRCIVYRVPPPSVEHMARIAAAHARDAKRTLTATEQELIREIAVATGELQDHAREHKLRPPGVAEFLDAVWAALDLGISIKSDEWQYVKRLTLAKDDGLA